MNVKKKVFQLNSELYKVTGIQRVMLDIHEALKDEFDAKIAGNIPFEKIDKALLIGKEDYLQFKNPLMFRNSVVVIHERRYLPLMWLLTHIPGLNVKCVYIHHNELFGNKLLSLFPKNVVAISDNGIKNLTEYFGVKEKNITKIHNCVRNIDDDKESRREYDNETISILYPARINSVKQQVEIVKNLRGEIDPRVTIQFAGIGPQYDELKKVCQNESQFICLGFRDDVPELLNTVDFMMLYSKHEGLPISLIEASMSGTPAICSPVGGNTEIIKDGANGFVVNGWNELIRCINNLPNLNNEKYQQMSKMGKEIYEEKFAFEKFKNNYLKLIKSVYADTCN